MIIKNTTLGWHKASEEKPAVSGDYIVYTTYGAIYTLQFNAKHGLWNVSDDDTSTAIPDNHIVAWAYIDSLHREMSLWKEELDEDC